MKQLLLSPSLMCGNLFSLKNDLQILQENKFPLVHLDVMDGHFVPNITFGFDLVNRIQTLVPIPKDIHLMMDYPDVAIRNLELNKKDIVVFHIECRSNPHYIIKLIREKKAKVGLAINPDTPIENIYPFLDKIDHALVMTVHPGFAGHQFVQTSYDRVRKLVEAIKKRSSKVTIGVDGAIGYEQIMTFNGMGVNLFVLGTTSLFKGNLSEHAANVMNFIKQLKESSSL